MLVQKVNKMRNPQFRFGKESPTHWDWVVAGRGARWTRTPGQPGITIVCGAATRQAAFRQSIRCKADQFYRIEATVQCSLAPHGAVQDAGLSLGVQDEDSTDDDARSSPPLQHAAEPIDIRAYYNTGGNTRRLRISIGVQSAAG